MAKQNDKLYLEQWNEFRDNTLKATPVDLTENIAQKAKRITYLEENPEEWFKYYFPNFYTAEPAPFHKKSTKLVLNNPEYYIVRSWSRELAKSARTMMEVLKLGLTGKKKNILLVSASYNDAERLLLPYKTILECNNRIINDYGTQESISNWEAGEFITRKGISFRAIGAGQSPRGTRNDASRPDVILIDDIDTDIDCRNPETIQKKYEWIEQALIPTRSISVPLLIIACGNIIAKYCCITEMGKKADTWEVVNIRDKNGKSTWPTKNTEEMIDRALKPISTSSQQKEYYNNPIRIGKIFKKAIYSKCPPLKSCEHVLIYADPATSNKDKSASSRKSVGVIGFKNNNFYLYKVWLDGMNQRNFVTNLYTASDYVKEKGVDVFKIWIENNSLQDPFYEQVIKPLIKEIGRQINKTVLYMSLDKRSKDDKFRRIEGTLEPIYKQGALFFNEDEKKNPHMERMEEEFLGVDPNSKMMDGPDMLEGGIWIIKNLTSKQGAEYFVGHISNRKY
jgi:hypothetical protein